jgi:hypothetical protein
MAQFDTINLAQIYGAADDTNFRRAQMDNYNKRAMREQKAYEMEEKLKGAYAIGPDGALDEKTTLSNLYRVDPMAANDFKQKLDAGALNQRKLAAEEENAKFNRIKQISGIYKDTATAIMANPTPQAAAINLQRFSKMTGEDVSQELEQISQMNPEQIKQWAAGHALEAEKVLTKFETKDTGGQLVTQGIDPITGKVTVSGTTQKTMSPAEIERNKIDKQRLGIDQAKFGLDKQKFGYQQQQDRLASAPGADGSPAKNVKLTEGERKSATLLTRMEGSLAQMDDVLNNNPSAAKPELLSSGVRGLTFGTQEALANTLTSSDRQRIESAQLDFLDAALTLGTGAAYTKEQLEGYRKSYFPQLGDSDAQVKDKAARRAKIIEAARIAAGNASDSVPKQTPSAPASPAVPKPGTVVDGYIFNGGNPADPKSWKKK